MTGVDMRQGAAVNAPASPPASATIKDAPVAATEQQLHRRVIGRVVKVATALAAAGGVIGGLVSYWGTWKTISGILNPPRSITEKFDGEWRAENDSWKLALEIKDGDVKGRVISCLNSAYGKWFGPGPTIIGKLHANGRMEAFTEKPTGNNWKDWVAREIVGEFPKIEIRADAHVQCKNGPLDVTRVKTEMK